MKSKISEFEKQAQGKDKEVEEKEEQIQALKDRLANEMDGEHKEAKKLEETRKLLMTPRRTSSRLSTMSGRPRRALRNRRTPLNKIRRWERTPLKLLRRLARCTLPCKLRIRTCAPASPLSKIRPRAVYLIRSLRHKSRLSRLRAR